MAVVAELVAVAVVDVLLVTVDDDPDEAVVPVELVEAAVLDTLLVAVDDVPDEAVAAIELVVAVTSITADDVVESPDPGSVVDVVAIMEATDSVLVAAAEVEVLVASITTELVDVKLSVVDMPIDDASLSIVADILTELLFIPTTTTTVIVNTTLS